MKIMLNTYKNCAGGGRSTFDESGNATAVANILVTRSYRDLSAAALPAAGVSHTVCAGFSTTSTSSSSFSTNTSSSALSPLSCSLPHWFSERFLPLAAALCLLWTQVSLRQKPWFSWPHCVALSTVASFAA